MDLVREILLEVEARDDGRAFRYEPENVSATKRHHVELLLKAGLLYEVGVTKGGRTKVHLTWEGHDFVDTVRETSIWEKTKETAVGAGGWTIGILSDIAKTLIRQRVSELLSGS